MSLQGGLAGKVAAKRKAQSTPGEVLVTMGDGVCRDHVLDLDTEMEIFMEK